ncbi:hypothetical protein BDF14DRAFT_1139781 [Spinellus fusiger]|nr:hypothetical protein BDF14DRAFT_1139781 [Spinellus fusiger]
MSAKAIQIAKDIDVCRCKGNWLAIPELARRYKKHNPDGTVLEQTILAEASLINSVQATHSTVSFREDTPHQVTLPPRLSSQLKSVQLQLNAALQTADHGTSMDRKRENSWLQLSWLVLIMKQESMTRHWRE